MSNPAPEGHQVHQAGPPSYNAEYITSTTGPATVPPGTYAPPSGPPPNQTVPPGTYAPPTGPPPQPFYPTPVSAPPVPGFVQPYQPSYQTIPTSLVYFGALVPNPETPPAPQGTSKVPGYDPAKDYGELKGAKKSGFMGSGWNESTLTQVLVKRNILQLDALSDYLSAETGKTLAEFLPTKGSLGSWFNEVIHALAVGPLGYDVELVRRAIKGAGTNEQLLIELLLNRSNNDIELLKRAYTKRYGSNLVQDVKNDVSDGTQTMFNMALMGQRPMNLPGLVDAVQVQGDIEDLYNHGPAKNSVLDEVLFCRILINRSDAHITAVIDGYGQKYKSLSKTIKSQLFSSTVKKGLLYIVHGLKSKRNKQEPYGTWRDAKLLEESMAGMGTNDEALVWRIVRAHWDPTRMNATKQAYLSRYGKTLERRVSKETSGSYKNILTELINKV